MHVLWLSSLINFMLFHKGQFNIILEFSILSMLTQQKNSKELENQKQTHKH